MLKIRYIKRESMVGKNLPSNLKAGHLIDKFQENKARND
jgi:hypothetical protein